MYLAALFALLQGVVTPTYPSNSQMVGVIVSATHENTGEPVFDMVADDFVVLEDGKRQQVTHFQREDVPASVLILLDTSLSMRSFMPEIRDSAMNLIRSLRPIDEVHVATFDVGYRVLSDFTEDREAAIASLDLMRPGGPTNLNQSLYVATRYLERQHRGEVRRRRILVLLSDGEDTESSQSYSVIEETLRRSSVVCYVVYIQRADTRGKLTQLLKRQAVLARRATQFVQTIVFDTGGKLRTIKDPYPRMMITRAFVDIAKDIGNQYYLGYPRVGSSDASGWKKVSVMTVRRSDVRLRYRTSYFFEAK